MAVFAVLSGDVVVNTIIADSKEIAENLTNAVCIEAEAAGIGFIYDEELGLVLPPKPFESWILNEEQTDWVAPVEKPEGDFVWDEETLDWVEAPAVEEPAVIEETPAE